MTINIDDLIACTEEYTREQFEADRARLRTAIAVKHGIAESEVHALVAEHRYRHEDGCPEDEYIECLAMYRHRAGET